MASQEHEISFRQGVDGYGGTIDTQISASAPGNQYSTAMEIVADSGPDKQVLLRFEDLFGPGGVPAGARIVSATLTLQTVGSGDGATIHRMSRSWSPTSTWASLAGGVSADGLEAVASPDVTTGFQNIGVSSFDVTSSVQAWANGEANHGWVFRSLGSNGWRFYSSEGAVRPQLKIRYATETAVATIAGEVSGGVTEDANPATLVASGVATIVDPDAGEASFRAASGATSYGRFTIAPNGSWTYSAANGQAAIQSLGANETLSDSFVITSLDGSASETVRIVITGTNDAPVAVSDTAQIGQNGSTTVNVLANDADVDGDALAVIAVGNAVNGVAVINPDKTITYTPASGFSGADSFSYTISDGKGGTSTSTVDIAAGIATVLQEHEISFRQGVDGYGGTIDTQISASAPGNQYSTAMEIVADSGPDKQVLLRFEDLFGPGGVPAGARIVSATLTLQTVGSGDGATIHRMSRSWSPTSTWASLAGGVSADGLEAVASPDVTTGFQNIGVSSFDVTSSVQAWANGEANHGWVFRSLGSNGWRFYSSEGAVRPQLKIRYATETAVATIAGEVSGGVTEDANPATLVASGVATIVDPDAGEASFRAASGATSYGRFTIAPNGSWTYSAANGQAAIQSLGANETLSDSFVITSLDGSASETVRIVITGTNDAPVAVSDTAQIGQNGSTTVNVLANDADVDGDALAVIAVGNAVNGVAVINPDKTITYTPASGFSGADSFSYTISDGKGGTSTSTVALNLTPPPPDNSSASYIAIRDTTSARNLEHDNSSKSFYHDGTWWAVLPGRLPDGSASWALYRYSGPPQAAGDFGGWSLASDALQNNNNLADIAWDAVNEKLYVLQFSSTSSQPYLFQLSYDHGTQSWTTTIEIDLSTTLNAAYWGRNEDLGLGIDQNGNPLITAIASGSQGKGLHLAYPTSGDLSRWGSTTIEPDTTSSGGSNGNSKADFVTFTKDAVSYIGLIYSKDGASADSWSFAWHNSASNTSDYASGWSREVVNSAVHIDDHVSAVSDGSTIYAAIKDDVNSIWLLKGNPGNWENPVLVVDGHKFTPSRPIVVLDETQQQLYVMYQGKGDIYMKATSTANPDYDPGSLGFKILDGTGTLYDPQGPVHSVGTETDGHFVLLAKNVGTDEVWYNQVQVGTSFFVA